MMPTPQEKLSPPPQFAPDRSLKEYLGLAARGFAMGCADIVPGVSGGTMALHSCILRRVGHEHPRRRPAALLAGAFAAEPPYRAGCHKRPFSSLCPGRHRGRRPHPRLLVGMDPGTPPRLYLELLFWPRAGLNCHRAQTNTGLEPFSLRCAGRWRSGRLLCSRRRPVQTPDASWFLFLSGMFAICAMILPRHLRLVYPCAPRQVPIRSGRREPARHRQPGYRRRRRRRRHRHPSHKSWPGCSSATRTPPSPSSSD